MIALLRLMCMITLYLSINISVVKQKSVILTKITTIFSDYGIFGRVRTKEKCRMFILLSTFCCRGVDKISVLASIILHLDVLLKDIQLSADFLGHFTVGKFGDNMLPDIERADPSFFGYGDGKLHT